MNLFHIVEDSQVILRSKGVFRQVAAFRRGDELFAKWGSGFIKLVPGGGTTVPSVSWVELDTGSLAYTKTPNGLKILDTVKMAA